MEQTAFQEYLNTKRELVDQYLPGLLPAEGEAPETLLEAMRYSLFSPGKRLRPILVLAGAEAIGHEIHPFLPAACATEFIHTYSLIHDDLPAIDDDNLRRGRPTSHKVFGEAMAILAGDALLTHAFQILTGPALGESFGSERVLRLVHKLALASGTTGMVGGQVADVQSEGKKISTDTLHYIHTKKTGALMAISVKTAAILTGISGWQYDSLSSYGEKIGLAFQIKDDILNVTGDASRLGKEVGSDQFRRKATYPSIFGLQTANRRAEVLVEESLKAIERFDEKADPLRSIAIFSIQREI